MNLNPDRLSFLKEINTELKKKAEELHQMQYGYSSAEEAAFDNGQESMLNSIIDEFDEMINHAENGK